MKPMLPHLIFSLPEIFVLVMVCVTLMAGLFFEKNRALPYFLVQLTLVIASILTWYSFMHLGATSSVLIFHRSFVLDKLAVILKIFIYITVFMTLLYSRHYNDDRRIPANEFYVLALISTLGMMVLVSAHNFLTLFLGLELLSLPIYAMVALQRGKSRCIEAAMKYFVIGALASGMLLYGMSMLFGVTQSIDIDRVATLIAAVPAEQNLILVFGLVFIMAGLAFKLGAAPFHMWVPDVYDGAPSSVTLFLSAAPKIAAFGMVIRLVVEAMPSLHVHWQEIFIVIGILSIAIGNIVAIVQTNIKRMLAYSSIAHMGYMVLGLACGTARGNAAALFYVISYSIMTLGAFGMVVLLSKAGTEANEINDFAGLNTRSPWLAFMMLLVMFSLAGVPPIVGFFAKVGILDALIQAQLTWLAVVALIFAVIGSYYYIRVVKVMYFEEPEHTETLIYPIDTQIAITVNGFAVLFLGIFPGALFHISRLTF